MGVLTCSDREEMSRSLYMIDKTKSKMGKARPWMLHGYFGCAVCLVAIFCKS